MPSINSLPKPSNAGWIAKIDANPDGEFGIAQAESPGQDHAFRDVNVAWYGDDRIKITLRGGGPAVIRQAYLSGNGQDVILDLIALPGGDAR
jgi:hypothetical protein